MPEPKKAGVQRVKKLAEKGYQHLRDEDYDAALSVARRLRKARFTAGFEIAALAHAGKNDLDAAIAVLEEGVALAPKVWLNLQLLGNYRSDLKRYDDAEAAYMAALQCPNVDASYVHLNLAILFERRGEHAEALTWADRVAGSPMEVHTIPLRIRAMSALGRHREAEKLASRLLKTPDVGDEYGSIAAALGWARLKRGVQRREVRAFAVKALSQARTSGELLSLIREIDDRYSKASKYWRLVVHVQFARPAIEIDGALGYFATYDVVAETRKEALRYIQSVEKPRRGAKIRIDSANNLEPRPEDPKGVYRMTGRSFYADDK